MRKRTTLIFILFGFLFGIAGVAYVKDKEMGKRNPSSLNSKPLWIPAPAGKHLALFKVEVQGPDTLPLEGQEEVTLTGRILVNQELQGELFYSWLLPDDVQVVEGNTSDSLVSVNKGQIVETKITVMGFGKDKQRIISLQASGRQGQELLGNTAILTSRPEDTWEAVAPEMKKAAEEQLGSEPKSRRGQQQ